MSSRWLEVTRCPVFPGAGPRADDVSSVGVLLVSRQVALSPGHHFRFSPSKGLRVTQAPWTHLLAAPRPELPALSALISHVLRDDPEVSFLGAGSRLPSLLVRPAQLSGFCVLL